MGDRAVPEQLIETLLANPFSVPVAQLTAATAELAAHTVEQAERWGAGPRDQSRALLALAHARALGGQSVELSARRRSHSIPARELRLAAASARCVARLRGMVGGSAALARVRRDAWAACFGQTLLHGLALERVVRGHDVLITGETGAGKEELAHAVAEGAPGGQDAGRAPFAEINAAAVPETLVESELFGHAKGAFTGATESRKGLVRSADGGCMFLDEVGDLPLLAQAKLLRVIETDRVQPLGTEQVHAVNVRFIAATHHDLPRRVREGRFRADLYQRLAGVVIYVPPLRERPEDIAAIGEHFITRALQDAPMEIDTTGLRRWLHGPEARRYGWPGNARELRNVVRSLLLGLPPGLASEIAEPPSPERMPARILRGELSLEELERWYVRRVVGKAGGNVAHAARTLGIDRGTVARKLTAR